MKNAHATPLALLTLLFPLAACTGGGNGALPLNEGAYTVDEFDYVDPFAPAFHPLGSDRAVINELAEQLVLVPYDRSLSGFGTGGEETLVWVDESQVEGFEQVPGPSNLFGFDLAIRGVAAGNFDGDAEKEWAATEVNADGHEIVLHTADRQEDGSVDTQVVRTFDPGAFQAKDSSILLADVDGDQRDELIVVARGNFFGNPTSNATIRVYDDPAAGAVELLYVTISDWHTGVWALPADVDGDGRPEVVLSYALGTYPNARHWVQVLEYDELNQVMAELHGWQLVFDDSFTDGSKPTVGDFDGDGRAELIVAKTFEFSPQMTVLLHEWSDSGQLVPRQWAAVPDILAPGDHYWTLTAFDRGAGKDELAILAYHSTGSQPWRLNLLTYEAVSDEWALEQLGIVHTFNGQRPALCSGDLDADGIDELQWGLVSAGNSDATLYRGYLSEDPEEGLRNLPARTFFGDLMRTGTPVLVSADWDGDGLEVEFTGRKELRLERPIPIAVLSAPPTQAGISQNLDDTSTRFESGSGTSETWAVQVGTTLSASVGAEFELFGLIQAGGRTTLEETIERTEAESSQINYVSGYSGTADFDTIVFQGTLRQSYEYRIVGAPDPAAIGQFITLDLPVDSKIYNWTVDYFNSKVAPEDQITSELLTHTPGRIGTYPRFHELEEALEGTLHWLSPTEQDVGQGPGSNDLEIGFVNENTTEEQRTVSVTVEGGVAIGAGVSGSSTDSRGSLYSITTTESTRFTTTIGKIEDVAEYEDWQYGWGLAVQTFGRAADADNNPTGYSGERLPFQWVRYYVNPIGFATGP